MVAIAPAPLQAQAFPEIGSSTWLTWEDYGQDACLARATQTMAAARTAFGLRDVRAAGQAGLAEAIDAGDTHAMIACAADFETRTQRSLVVISAHTSRLGLDGPLRDFLVACMTTPRCSPQPIAGVATMPNAGQARTPTGRPGQALPPPIAMPTTPGGARPGTVARPGGPPRVAAPGAPPGPAGVPTAVSGGSVASLGNVPPPGPPESANLRWPRPNPQRMAARQPQQPAAPAAAAATGALSAFCQFGSGRLAGQTVDYSRYPGVSGAAIGSYCADAQGSEGVVVAPTAAAVQATPPAAPAQATPLPGGSQLVNPNSAFCRFTQGPLAGRVIDYSRYPDFPGGPLGYSCGDGQGSTGTIVAPTAAAIPAQLPTQRAPAQQTAQAFNVSGAWVSNRGDRFDVVQTSPTSFTWSSSTRRESGSGQLRGQTVQANWGSAGSGTGTITQVDSAGRALRIEGGGLVLTRPGSAMAACALPGRWRNDVTALGASTWDIDANGVARETGMAGITAQARLVGNRLEIQGQNQGYNIYYSAQLGPDCSGAGQLVLTDPQGRQQTYTAQFTSEGGAQPAVAQSAALRASAGCIGFAGVWNTNYGPLWMYDNGRGGIDGRYDWNPPSGPRRGDRLSGNIARNILQGQYIQPGFPDSRWAQGGFRFVLSADGNSFSGSGTSSDGGTSTPWNGTCAGPPQ